MMLEEVDIRGVGAWFPTLHTIHTQKELAVDYKIKQAKNTKLLEENVT